MQYLDEIDPKAAKIGAVNTIVNSNGIFRGYNTDYIGAKKALEKNAEVKGRNVVILGAGGASRAVALAVMELGGSLTILNRTQEKAGQIADEMGCSFGSLHELNDLKPDILINCTSVGMLDENSPVEKSLLKNITVMEVVYSKEKTRLIKDAEANGCKTINGMEMYLYQGIAQEKLWNNIDVSVELMRQASNANNAD
jgi:shikimate dehydrogenase